MRQVCEHSLELLSSYFLYYQHSPIFPASPPSIQKIFLYDLSKFTLEEKLVVEYAYNFFIFISYYSTRHKYSYHADNTLSYALLPAGHPS